MPNGIKGEFRALDQLDYIDAFGSKQSRYSNDVVPWSWQYVMPELSASQIDDLTDNADNISELLNKPEWEGVREDISKQLIAVLNLPDSATPAIEKWLLDPSEARGIPAIDGFINVGNVGTLDDEDQGWSFAINEDPVQRSFNVIKGGDWGSTALKDWEYSSASTTQSDMWESMASDDFNVEGDGATVANGEEPTTPAKQWEDARIGWNTAPPGSAVSSREFDNQGMAIEWLKGLFPNSSDAEIQAMMNRGEFHIAPGGPFGGFQIIRGPQKLAETSTERPAEVVGAPRTGGFLQLTDNEFKPLGLGAAPSKLEYEGGILWMRDTQGNLSPVKNIMEAMVSQKIIEGDLEGALQWDDFADRPNPQESLQMMLEYARTPADQVVLSAIARGYTEGLIPPNAGQLSRVGPIPKEATQAWDRYQRAIGGPGREQSEQIAAEAETAIAGAQEETKTLADALADAETKSTEQNEGFANALTNFAKDVNSGVDSVTANANLADALAGIDAPEAESVANNIGSMIPSEEETEVVDAPADTPADTTADGTMETFPEDDMMSDQTEGAAGATVTADGGGGGGGGGSAGSAQPIEVTLKENLAGRGWTPSMIAQEVQAWKLNNPDWNESAYHAHLSELYYKGKIDSESFKSHMSDYGVLPSRHTRLSLRDELKRTLGEENYNNLPTAGGDVDAFLRDNPNPTDEDVAKFFSKFTETAKESGALMTAEPEVITNPDGSKSTTTITFDWEGMADEGDFLGSIAKSGDKNETKTAIAAGVAANQIPDDEAINEWFNSQGSDVTADKVYGAIDGQVSGGNVNPNGTIPTETLIDTIAEDMGMPSMGGQFASQPDLTANLPLAGSASTGANIPTPGGSTTAVETTPGFNKAMQTPEDTEIVPPVIIPDDETEPVSTGVAPATPAVYVSEEDYMAPTAFSMDSGDDDYLPAPVDYDTYETPDSFAVTGDDFAPVAEPTPTIADVRQGALAPTISTPTPNPWDYSDDDWFAGGGRYDDNTAIVGESGPELAIFPVGTEIVPLDRKMKPSQARRLRRRGIRGMEEGGFVFGPDEIESRGGTGNVGAVPGASTLNDPRYITNETLEGIRGGSLTQNPDDPYDIYSSSSSSPESALQSQVMGAQASGANVGPGLREPTFEESLAGVRGGELGDLPIGIQQILGGRSPRPLAGRLLRQAGMTLPSAQAWRNLSPDEQSVYTDLARRSGISEGYLQSELATSRPSGGGGARRGRMLPLATRRGFRR